MTFLPYDRPVFRNSQNSNNAYERIMYRTSNVIYKGYLTYFIITHLKGRIVSTLNILLNKMIYYNKFFFGSVLGTYELVPWFFNPKWYSFFLDISFKKIIILQNRLFKSDNLLTIIFAKDQNFQIGEFEIFLILARIMLNFLISLVEAKWSREFFVVIANGKVSTNW